MNVEYKMLDRNQRWLLLLICVAVVILRRPDVVANPQFWAEDGKIWFANAMNIGEFRSIFLPQNGYLQTISRLTAAIAAAMPMRFGPLVFNLVAIAIQVLPVVLLNTQRGRVLVPSAMARIALSALYLAQPYTTEVHANLTNAQWHLAVSAAIVVCFDSWRSKREAAFDIVLILLSGLSGPFCVLLVPVGAWLLYRRRDRRTGLIVAILAATAILQLALAIPQMGVSRAVAPLGASLPGFLRIVGGQVVLAGLLGDAWTHIYLSPLWREGVVVPLAATFGGVIAFARAARIGSDAARCFMIFAVFAFAAAMLSPQLSSTAQWVVWEIPHAGERYSFLPILGLYVALLTLAACDGIRLVRILAMGAMAVVFFVAIPASWKIRPFQDYSYQLYVDEYLHARPGEVVRIPLNPPGWFMELHKRTDASSP